MIKRTSTIFPGLTATVSNDVLRFEYKPEGAKAGASQAWVLGQGSPTCHMATGTWPQEVRHHCAKFAFAMSARIWAKKAA